MRILFCSPLVKAPPWVEGLRRALPGADVQEWRPSAAQADHAVVWAPPQQFLDEQPGLKGIFTIGAGVDAMLPLQLPPQAKLVRISDGGMAVQMAEYVCHALIRHFRELDRYEDGVRHGIWSYRPQRERAEFPVGIMGLGVLGERVCQAVRQFEFPLRGWSRTRKDLPGVECFAGPDEFDAFLAGTRGLVCLLPLTAETEGIMNRRTLSMLMSGGFVINVARGAHLIEEDLLALLDSGHLAGAALDVFRAEPLPQGHPFLTHPKITITPHTSARTVREESIAQIVGKIRAMERGEPVSGVVDLERGY